MSVSAGLRHPERLRTSRIEIRCVGCGYGAVVRDAPARCPMCGGTVWSTRRSGS